ncbi:MAG: transcriptional regulator [Planctomycetes bacterium]|nr:transcriptional regulator [Planctomycetota bacterium]
MDIYPIRTENDYTKALGEIERLWAAEEGTDAGDMLDILVILVEDYEKKHHVIDPPDPVEAIKFRMEQMGLKHSDVAPYFGGKNRVSEVLRHKRKLTVHMMRNLSEKLNIPAESLLSC